MTAEGFIKEKEIQFEKPLSDWNRTAIKKAINEFAEAYHQEKINEASVAVPEGNLCHHNYVEINSSVRYMECSKCGNVLV
jgi:hypothetical protein